MDEKADTIQLIVVQVAKIKVGQYLHLHKNGIYIQFVDRCQSPTLFWVCKSIH
jgi:hypothetical protein